jgi:hypothetical protein
MKKIVFISALFLYSISSFGQIDDPQFYKQETIESILRKDCNRAQIMYRTYLEAGGKPDRSIKDDIDKLCNGGGNSIPIKLIAGISNGIIAGELIGAYGELKFGREAGFAFTGGYGLGMGELDNKRWSAGVKGFYKNWFLSSHYGTAMRINNTDFTSNNDGTFILPSKTVEVYNGVSLLTGYDRTFGLLHFNAGVGGTVPTSGELKFSFAWNVGLGISLTDLFKK